MASPLEVENDPKFLDDVRKKEDENYSYALQLVHSTELSMSLHTVIELGVFDIIAKAGEGAKLSPEEIAERMATNNHEAPMMLDRLLWLLACHSVLNCSVVSAGNKASKFPRLYSLGPVSKCFVTNEDGVSLGPLMAMTHEKIFLDSWPHLKDAILEGGIPFNRAHGMHFFEYLGLDPRLNQVFNKAMHNQSVFLMKNLLKFYKGFNHLQQLVDVGGGLGVALELITSKFPHIKGINFDLPHVIEHAPIYPGVEHVGGNMFDNVPKGDAIFMKGILHDWNDEHCLKLLKNCYKSIPNNGKLIVVEPVFPVQPETSAAVKYNSQLDVAMMTQTLGGKERTQKKFLALATGAGFSGIKFEYLMCGLWIMEFFK